MAVEEPIGARYRGKRGHSAFPPLAEEEAGGAGFSARARIALRHGAEKLSVPFLRPLVALSTPAESLAIQPALWYTAVVRPGDQEARYDRGNIGQLAGA